jgi:hypothetical protein
MKFKIVLWVLGFMLERASKTNPRFQRKLTGQDLTLEIGCRGGYARHFIIRNQRVMSYPGKASEPVFLTPAHEPTFAITFDSAATGVEVFTGKDKQLAMVSGLHDKRITLEGNPLYLMWFQSLVKLLAVKD